jgi:hypothetical protein
MARLHRSSCELLELSFLNTRRFCFSCRNRRSNHRKAFPGIIVFDRERVIALALKSMRKTYATLTILVCVVGHFMT